MRERASLASGSLFFVQENPKGEVLAKENLIDPEKYIITVF